MQPPEGKNAPPSQSPLLHSAEILLQLRDEFQRQQEPPPPHHPTPYQDSTRYQHRPHTSEPWTQRSPGRTASRAAPEDSYYRGEAKGVHRLARSDGWGPRDGEGTGVEGGGTRRATAAAALLTLEGLRLQRGEPATVHSPLSPPTHAPRPPPAPPMSLAPPPPWPVAPQAHAPTAVYSQFYPSSQTRPTPALQHPMTLYAQPPDASASMSWPVHDNAATAFLSRRPVPNALSSSSHPVPMITDPPPTTTTWASPAPPEQQFTWLALSENGGAHQRAHNQHQPPPALRIPPQPPPVVVPPMLMQQVQQAPLVASSRPRPTKAMHPEPPMHHSAGPGAISLRRFLHDPSLPDPSLVGPPPLFPMGPHALSSGGPSPPLAVQAPGGPWYPPSLDPSLGLPPTSSCATLVPPHSMPFLYPSSSAMTDAPVHGLSAHGLPSDTPLGLPHPMGPMGLRMSSSPSSSSSDAAPLLGLHHPHPHPLGIGMGMGIGMSPRDPSPRHAVPFPPPPMLKMHPHPHGGPIPGGGGPPLPVDPTTGLVTPHLISPGRQLSPQELFLLMHEQQQGGVGGAHLNPLGRSRSAPLLDHRGGGPPASVESLMRLHQQQHPHEGPVPQRCAGYGGGGGPVLPSHYRRPMSASRRAKIDRYLEKRARRVWSKSTVRYKVRKNFADSRKRVRGRFISKKAELALGSTSNTDGESGGEESSTSSVTSLTAGGGKADGPFLPAEQRGPIPPPQGPTGTPEQGPQQPRPPPRRKQSVDTEEEEEEDDGYYEEEEDEGDHDSRGSKEGARAKST